MRRAYTISLLVIVALAGLLADRHPDTAAELYPLAGAIGWVEGSERALSPELVGAGVHPMYAIRVGARYVPRTPPPLMLYYGLSCRLYRDAVARPLDGADIPKLSGWINFLGVLPWAILLFGGLFRLSGLFGCPDGTKRIWAAWAAMAGSLALGWLGVVSVYLPVAALGCWTAAFVLEGKKKPSAGLLVLAGLLGGLAGVTHPTGWLWVVWGVFLLIVSPPSGISAARQAFCTVSFAISAALVILLSLVGNHLFFGSPLPVQWIDLQPITMGAGGLIRLVWHDLAGWNGILWLSPLLIPGLVRLVEKPNGIPGGSTLLLITGLLAMTLFVWGVVDDARLIGELDRIHPQLRVLPIELTGGKLEIVPPGNAQGGAEEQRADFERLVARTDIFLWTGGRPVGLPVFMPVACVLALLGWHRSTLSRFRQGWGWIAVRIGGLLGLIMSQAPYGSISDYSVYVGYVLNQAGAPVHGNAPIVEAVLAIAIRLAELWPSGVVTF